MRRPFQAYCSLLVEWQVDFSNVILLDLLSPDEVVVVGPVVQKRARLQTKLFDEEVGEAVVMRNAHWADLSLPAVSQISDGQIIKMVQVVIEVGIACGARKVP